MEVYNDETEWGIPELEDTFELTSEDYLRLDPMINQVAATEYKASNIFDTEDIAQELWVHVVAKWPAYRGKDQDLQYFMLRRFARAWCKQQRVEYMYATGAYVYTPKEIRIRLDDSVFVPLGQVVDVDARVDILREYEQLSRGRRAAIYKQYALGESLGTPAERVACSEGVEIICTTLNLGAGLVALPLEEEYRV